MTEAVAEVWTKLGRVFDPDSWDLPEWWNSHAALPTPIRVDDDTVRVYVAAWDEDDRGRVGYVNVAAKDPRFVRSVSREPALGLGAPGTFDEHGVNPSSVMVANGDLYLLYVGWQRLQGIRYTLFSGLAKATGMDGREFERVSQTPILDRTGGERYVRTAPIFAGQVGGRTRVWYSGGDEWIDVDGKQTPTYTLREIVSPTENPARLGSDSSKEILALSDDEIGIGRPAVVPDNGKRRVWYSARTREGYRIRYAEADQMSPNLKRVDGPVIRRSVGGIKWDSDMVCFPATIELDGDLYAFYNGNEYGKTGFGVARLEGRTGA